MRDTVGFAGHKKDKVFKELYLRGMIFMVILFPALVEASFPGNFKDAIFHPVGENSVALVGKNPTKQKMERLKKSQVEHFIVTIEKGADRSMMILADALTGVGKEVTVWEYQEGDPADSADYTEKPYDLRTKMEILLKS